MAIYHCKGFRLIGQQVECDVEADSPEEAENKAIEMFQEEDCEYENDFGNTPEVSGDIEVEEVVPDDTEGDDQEEYEDDSGEEYDIDDEDQDEYEEEE